MGGGRGILQAVAWRELNAFERRIAPVVEWASGRPFQPFSGPFDFLWRLLLGTLSLVFLAWVAWYVVNVYVLS